MIVELSYAGADMNSYSQNKLSSIFHHLLNRALVAAIANPAEHVDLCDALQIVSRAKFSDFLLR